MPMPATHIYYAQKFLGNKLSKHFIAGTLVNDIGYLFGKYSRLKTHNYFVEDAFDDWSILIAKIEKSSMSKDDSDFYLGMLFHMHIDCYWRDAMDVHSSSPRNGFLIQFIDELYCLRRVNCRKIALILKEKDITYHDTFKKEEADHYFSFIIKYFERSFLVFGMPIIFAKKHKMSVLEVVSMIFELFKLATRSNKFQKMRIKIREHKIHDQLRQMISG